MNNSVAAMETVWVVGVKGEGREWKNKWCHCMTKPTVQPHLDCRVLSSSCLRNGKTELKRIQRKDSRVTETWKAAMEWLINKPYWSQGLFSHEKRQRGKNMRNPSTFSTESMTRKQFGFCNMGTKSHQIRLSSEKVQNGQQQVPKLWNLFPQNNFNVKKLYCFKNASALIHTQHRTLKGKLEVT